MQRRQTELDVRVVANVPEVGADRVQRRHADGRCRGSQARDVELSARRVELRVIKARGKARAEHVRRPTNSQRAGDLAHGGRVDEVAHIAQQQVGRVRDRVTDTGGAVVDAEGRSAGRVVKQIRARSGSVRRPAEPPRVVCELGVDVERDEGALRTVVRCARQVEQWERRVHERVVAVDADVLDISRGVAARVAQLVDVRHALKVQAFQEVIVVHEEPGRD